MGLCATILQMLKLSSKHTIKLNISRSKNHSQLKRQAGIQAHTWTTSSIPPPEESPPSPQHNPLQTSFFFTKKIRKELGGPSRFGSSSPPFGSKQSIAQPRTNAAPASLQLSFHRPALRIHRAKAEICTWYPLGAFASQTPPIPDIQPLPPAPTYLAPQLRYSQPTPASRQLPGAALQPSLLERAESFRGQEREGGEKVVGAFWPFSVRGYVWSYSCHFCFGYRFRAQPGECKRLGDMHLTTMLPTSEPSVTILLRWWKTSPCL